MIVSGLGRFALISGAAAVLLAGCGGASQQVVVPQAAAARRHVSHLKAWMAPSAKSSAALIYYADGGDFVDVLSYPQGKLVGTLKGFDVAQGVCSDTAGNVFVTTSYTETVIEYAHGGSEPIATLGDYGYYPFGCAVDPVTGNLSVANVAGFDGSPGTVAIYSGAKGKPTYYTASGFNNYRWCAYDASGKLFVDGDAGLAELPLGGQKFQKISVTVSGEGLKWDGQYLAMVNASSKVVYRISVSNSFGTVVQTVGFRGLLTQLGNDFVFADSKIVMPYRTLRDTRLGTWTYPKGGNLRKHLHKIGGLQTITLSY